MTPVYLNAMGLVNALGDNVDAVRDGLCAARTDGMREHDDLIPGQRTYVGEITSKLAPLDRNYPELASRNIQILNVAIAQIQADIDAAIAQYGASRIGIVLGSCTSGTAEGIDAMAVRVKAGAFAPEYDYRIQDISTPTEYLRQKLGITGPAWSVSTACTSSAKSFSSGRRLLNTGLCDAVIVGGVDALCRLTVNGFYALESIDPGHCQPFSGNRCGINIGEAAAVFLMTREPGPVTLLGVGETSDAHHISAPDPEGKGAEEAIRMAIAQAGVSASAIDYVNLHGTATIKNDLMESHAVYRVVGDDVPCSSSKGMVGHTMGTAGATEAAICWIWLAADKTLPLPPNVYDGVSDPALAPLHLCQTNDTAHCRVTLSNSFAFGGNNACIALGQG